MNDTERAPPPIYITIDGDEIEVTSLAQAVLLLDRIVRRVEALEEGATRLRDETSELAGRFNMHVEGSGPDDY